MRELEEAGREEEREREGEMEQLRSSVSLAQLEREREQVKAAGQDETISGLHQKVRKQNKQTTTTKITTTDTRPTSDKCGICRKTGFPGIPPLRDPKPRPPIRGGACGG